jgi:predicted N-acetyltransferase YhbS
MSRSRSRGRSASGPASCHQGRGIASHILAAGLDRLAAHGCRRLKVSNDIGLYLRAGFRPVSTAPVLRPARPITGSLAKALAPDN